MVSARPPEPAIVMLCHADPVQVRRLVSVFSRQPIVLHCDAKTPAEVHSAMTEGLPDRVRLAPRLDTRLASWSLVRAELAGLRIALAETDAEHIVVLSGADYPLVDPDQLADLLAPFAGQSWMWNTPLPFPAWDVPGFRDGGAWRMRHRFLTKDDQIRWLARKPLFVPLRRAIPADLEPRASTHWKIICRADAAKLLDLLERRPDLVAFGRSTFTPEESFLASLLASPALWGSQALPPCLLHPWLASWPEDRAQQHPDWFGEPDLPWIVEALQSVAEQTAGAAVALPHGGRPLFARKFRSEAGPDFFQRLQELLW